MDNSRPDAQLAGVTDKGGTFSSRNFSWFASRDSPKRLVFILIAAIFLGEVFAMLVLFWLPEMPYALETLLDASIMVGLILPLLYYLVFRPLLEHIAERERGEQALIQTNELLERYFSSIDTLIAYMDRNFDFIRVNDAYARSGGHPA